MTRRTFIRDSKIGRDSSRSIARYGAPQVPNNGSIRSNDYLNLRNMDISSVIMSSSTLVSDSFKSAEFDVAFSHFEKRSGSRRLAQTMAAVSLDVASILGINIDQVLNSLTDESEVADILRKKSINIMNKLRDPTDQHMVVKRTTNRGKPRSRLVSP